MAAAVAEGGEEGAARGAVGGVRGGGVEGGERRVAGLLALEVVEGTVGGVEC